jgi:transcriptional regulator with XRE-family HTH domain
MTGAEFRFLRKQLQMGQAGLAKYLSVTDQTIANYEKGKSGKDGFGPADAFMRAFYLLQIVPEQTRVKVIKPLLDASAQRHKLSELSRHKIVESWREGDHPKIAA